MENDALTGALSSMGFKERVTELLRENPDTQYFLTYANIKDFKYINDSLGRKAGDDLLRYWFTRTAAYLTDKEALGRMGGDRMSVLRVATDDDDLYKIDSSVHEHVRNYFVAQGEEYRVRISGGIYALSPEDYENPNVDQMLDYARVAEKRVRETFADGYEFYNAEQWNAGRRNAEIVAHLPAALEGGEIKVWYQPQVDFDTGQIVGSTSSTTTSGRGPARTYAAGTSRDSDVPSRSTSRAATFARASTSRRSSRISSIPMTLTSTSSTSRSRRVPSSRRRKSSSALPRSCASWASASRWTTSAAATPR